MDFSADITSRANLLIKVRRELHKMPEETGKEFKTSDYICAFLKERKFKPVKIQTGVYIDIEGQDKTKLTALRCDIDALPIVENTKVDYASKNGFMHACGHDGHTAMLLTVADILKDKKPLNNVRLIFQFGEEGAGGAPQMIEGGVLKNVDEIYALHVNPYIEKGKLATTAGALFAGTVEFEIIIKGKASHCAYPDDGIDAIAATNYILNEITKLKQLYSRNNLIHVGKITAGVATNIVADYSVLNCTLRFFNEDVQEEIIMKLANILNDADKIYKTNSSVEVGCVYPPLINSGNAVAKLKKLIPSLDDNYPANFTAEDFAYYLQKVNGCMVWLGIKDNDFDMPLHSDKFGFNEDALLYGVDFFLKLIL